MGNGEKVIRSPLVKVRMLEDKQRLLTRIERLGKLPPSQLNYGYTLEIKQLLRDLYVYVRDGKMPEKTTEELIEETLL